MKETKTDTRGHETEIAIDAPAEALWKAITDPRELTNWFPLQAEVEPGEGGRVELGWGPEMRGVSRIEAWDPPRLLRTSWFDPSQSVGDGHPSGSEHGTIVEYRIESRHGQTVLRLVHSGFGRGADWDEEYDGTRRGWAHELRSLRHYLERHRGRRREVAWVRQPVAVEPEEMWNRLMGPEGLGRAGAPDHASEGDPYVLESADGQRFEGAVQVFGPPRDFAGTVENLGDALFRIAYDRCFGTPEAHLWLSVWGRPESEVQAIERSWKKMLERLFPATA
jgi:uncharacterized protein YndB with AHSA1/START domain